MKTRFSVIVLLCAIAACAAFTGCRDNNDTTPQTQDSPKR